MSDPWTGPIPEKFSYNGKVAEVSVDQLRFWRLSEWPLLGYYADENGDPWPLPTNPADPNIQYLQPGGIDYYRSPGGDLYYLPA